MMKLRFWEESLADSGEEDGEGAPALDDALLPDDERRREPRYDCKGLKIIIRQRRALGIIHLQNLSASGAHGLTDMPLSPGAIVFLELKRARFFGGTVTWAKSLGIGVEFNRPLRPDLMKKLIAKSRQRKR